MRIRDRIPVLVHRLAATYAPMDIPWLDFEPEDLFALSLDAVAGIAETISTGGSVDDVIGDIAVAISYLGMMADTIQHHGRVVSKIDADVRELGEWLVEAAPEEVGHADDENIVQTALRLLKRQYEDTKH